MEDGQMERQNMILGTCGECGWKGIVRDVFGTIREEGRCPRCRETGTMNWKARRMENGEVMVEGEEDRMTTCRNVETPETEN